MSVGDWGVVEVAHEDKRCVAVLVDKGGERIGLSSAYGAALGYFAYEIKLAVYSVSLFGPLHEGVIFVTLFLGEMHGL